MVDITLRFVTGPAAFACECNIGYTGNGTACGVDSDGDGFPDNALNCNGPTCLVDNCPNLPNSDQVKIPHTCIATNLLVVFVTVHLSSKFSSIQFLHIKIQADKDNDSIGDECDSDIDADLLVNYRDPCPYDDTTMLVHGLGQEPTKSLSGNTDP